MCDSCQSYDNMLDERHIVDASRELASLNIIRNILYGKRFHTFMHMYTYVNTVHMRKEIEKYGGDAYCLGLRRDPMLMKSLCEVETIVNNA